jgi:DNA-directed RNA polymerase specialized sigma24 family protein
MNYQEIAPVHLARLCANNDSEAWLEFIHRYQRPITLVILRTLREAGSTSTLLIDDLVQETYAALCANGCRLLRDFVEEYPSSLDAMVRVVAANLTHDHLRAQNAKKRGPTTMKRSSVTCNSKRSVRLLKELESAKQQLLVIASSFGCTSGLE